MSLDKLRDTLAGYSLMENLTLSCISPSGTLPVSESKEPIKVSSWLWQGVMEINLLKYSQSFLQSKGLQLGKRHYKSLVPPRGRESPGLQSLPAFLSHSTKEGQTAKSRSQSRGTGPHKRLKTDYMIRGFFLSHMLYHYTNRDPV